MRFFRSKTRMLLLSQHKSTYSKMNSKKPRKFTAKRVRPRISPSKIMKNM